MFLVLIPVPEYHSFGAWVCRGFYTPRRVGFMTRLVNKLRGYIRWPPGQVEQLESRHQIHMLISCFHTILDDASQGSVVYHDRQT